MKYNCLLKTDKIVHNGVNICIKYILNYNFYYFVRKKNVC